MQLRRSYWNSLRAISRCLARFSDICVLVKTILVMHALQPNDWSCTARLDAMPCCVQFNAPMGQIGGMCNNSAQPYDKTACSGQNALCNTSYYQGASLDGSDYDRYLGNPSAQDPAVVRIPLSWL